MQHDIAQIDAYVRGKLSPAEQSALELEILENPDMLAEFELAIAMRKGVMQLELPLVKEAKSSYWWQPWIGRPMVTGVTMAMAVVALVQLASLSSRGDLSRDDQTPAALSANVPILTFSRIRSARDNTDYSVLVDKDAMQSGLMVLELEIDWPPQPVYEVTIAAQTHADTALELPDQPPSNQRQTDAAAVTSHGNSDGKHASSANTVNFQPQTLLLNPDARGYLVMAMPTGQLTTGDYLITIEPPASEKSAANKNAVDVFTTDDQQSVADTGPSDKMANNNMATNNMEVAAQQVYRLRVKSAN